MRIWTEACLCVCSLVAAVMLFGCKDTCTKLRVPAVSGWPEGYVMDYDVEEPCEQYTNCMECLPGPTGLGMCQWCGNSDGTGVCISEGSQCAEGQTPLADHWNGYCPEFCDRMDGTSCYSCTRQMDPFDEGCSWCPETQDCFNERASQVGLQPADHCGMTKAGPYGVECSEVPPYCSDPDPCTDVGLPAVSRWPEGYTMDYDVEAPCEQYGTCVECLPGPTGASMCQWCGNADGSGVCISKDAQCGTGQTPLADHWNGYCPEFCDRMDGTNCTSCTNQIDPFDEACSWCPETQDCFNERASEVALQSPSYCGATKAGPHGVPCSEVPANCAK